MNKPITILGIAGSLRRQSYNRSALRAAQQLAPEGVTLNIFELDGIPGFNEDDEKNPPAKVVELKKQQAADEGRDRQYTWGLAVDPDDPECWYVSANPDARLAHQSDESTEARIYRWHDGGSWEALGGGLPEPMDSFPYALAMNSRSLFAGLRDGRIYRSEDRGEH